MAPEATTPDVAILYELIGQRMREARERSGFTQDQLAVQAGVSRASITQSESGHQRLPLQSLYLIAAALAIGIWELLPSVEDLSTPSRDIFERLSSDQTLDGQQRDALVTFFGRVVPEGAK